VLPKVFVPGDSRICLPQLDFRVQAQTGLNHFHSPEFNSGAISSSGGWGVQVYPPSPGSTWGNGHNPGSGHVGYVQSPSSYPVYEPNYGSVNADYFGNVGYVAPYPTTNPYGVHASNNPGY
jgi:hypothetical protein